MTALPEDVNRLVQQWALDNRAGAGSLWARMEIRHEPAFMDEDNDWDQDYESDLDRLLRGEGRYRVLIMVGSSYGGTGAFHFWWDYFQPPGEVLKRVRAKLDRIGGPIAKRNRLDLRAYLKRSKSPSSEHEDLHRKLYFYKAFSLTLLLALVVGSLLWGYSLMK